MAALSITAANVIKSSVGQTLAVKLAPGVTVTQGQAIYSLGDGTYGLADANATAPANSFAGIALSAGSAGQTIAICTSDTGAFINGATGMTVGSAIYIGDTPGSITQVLADATGGTSIYIGSALSATTQNIVAGGVIGGTVA